MASKLFFTQAEPFLSNKILTWQHILASAVEARELKIAGRGLGGLINRSTWYILVDRIRFYVKSHREDSPLVILGMLKFVAYHLDYVYSFFDN